MLIGWIRNHVWIIHICYHYFLRRLLIQYYTEQKARRVVLLWFRFISEIENESLKQSNLSAYSSFNLLPTKKLKITN